MAKQTKIMMTVSGLKSELDAAALTKRYEERMSAYRAVPGLLQKYYCYDEANDEWAGVHIWESRDAMNAFVGTELQVSIPTAYQLINKPVVTIVEIVDVLR